MEKGIFITFEGGDGSGKSTQIKLLSSFLENKGKQVVLTREPGGTLLAETIRNILQHDIVNEQIALETEILLLSSARAQHTHSLILPSLSDGKTVISDRYIDSSLVYQGYARGFDISKVLDINLIATKNTSPDLTFFLDIPAEQGISRIKKRYSDTNEKLDRFERETLDFHIRVRQGYLDLAKKFPNRIVVVDASRSIEDVHKNIIQVIEKFGI